MRAFFAETGTVESLKKMQTHDIGRMWSRDHPRLYENEVWGFDNGAWSAFVSGKKFPGDEFLNRLDRAYDKGMPYIAVCPDIVMGGMKSLEFSLMWRENLPDEWPWYLAVQDGMELMDVYPFITDFSGIFVGGSRTFKSSASSWKQLGKPVHMARVGTRKMLNTATRHGVDSFDSATPVVNGQKYLDMFLSWYLEGDPQSELF